MPPLTSTAEAEEVEDSSPVTEESDSDSSAWTEDEADRISDDDTVSSDYLESLLEKARSKAAASKAARGQSHQNHASLGFSEQADIMLLDDKDLAWDTPLPALEPGPSLATPYFEFKSQRDSESNKSSHVQRGILIRDPQTEQAEKASASAPKTLDDVQVAKTGQRPTKRQKKELKRHTTGPSWFDMPAPDPSDIPKLYREIEALRMRNALDPKRWYRKDDGESKGIKGLPKYFAIGKVIDTPTPFNQTSQDNLSRTERKQTLVEELVADSEAKSVAKRKFLELQRVRGAKGRNTLHIKNAARRRKW